MLDDLAVGVAAHPADAAGRGPTGGRAPPPASARRHVAAHDDRVRTGEGVVGEDRVERRQVAVDVVERGDDGHPQEPTTPARRVGWSGRRYHSLIMRRSTRIAPRAVPPTPRAADAARTLGEPELDDRVRAGAAHRGRHRAARQRHVDRDPFLLGVDRQHGRGVLELARQREVVRGAS